MSNAIALKVKVPPFHANVLYLFVGLHEVCSLTNHQHTLVLSKVSMSDLPYGRTLNKCESTVVTWNVPLFLGVHLMITQQQGYLELNGTWD